MSNYIDEINGKNSSDNTEVSIDAKEETKYLYCPKCKTYPNKIKEVYSHYVEHRRWDGECYATVDVGQDTSSEYYCEECNTELEEK